MNSKIYDEWLKVNVELHNKLEELKKLDKERATLIKEAEDVELTEELKKKMNLSVAKYENLLEEIKVVKLRAETLKKEVGE